MKNKGIGFVAGIIIIILGYFALYPFIAKHLFFNQFDYIQNQISRIDSKRDATCWTTVRQIESYYADTALDEVLVQLNIEIIKDVIKRILFQASTNSKFLPMLTKQDIYKAIPESLSSQFNQLFVVEDLESKNFYNQYKKLSENWRVLYSVLDSYLVSKWDDSITSYPSLKPLSEEAMNYVATITIDITAIVLRESGKRVQQGSISEDVLKTVYQDIIRDFKDAIPTILRDQHTYYFESKEAVSQFLVQKNRVMMKEKMVALHRYNLVNEDKITYHDLLTKLVKIPITSEASELIVSYLNNFINYIGMGTNPMFGLVNYTNSPNAIFSGQFPYDLKDFKSDYMYLSLNVIYEHLSKFFPVFLHSNGDVLLKKGAYYEFSDQLSKDVQTYKLLSYESDAVRDSGIHWKFLYSLWQDDKKLPVDAFGLELLAERVSIFLTYLLRESEKYALTLNKSTIDISDVKSIFKDDDFWMPFYMQKHASSWFNKGVKDQFFSEQKLPFFEDISQDVGINQESYFQQDYSKDILQYLGSGLGVGDVNNDGFIDVFLVREGGNKLYINNGDRTFSDKTAFYQLNDPNIKDTSQALFVDINNDGRLDLFTVHAYSNSQLFLQMKDGKFKNITNVSGIRTLYGAQTAVFFDMDNDGLLDLFVGHFGPSEHGNYRVSHIKKILGEEGLDDSVVERFLKTQTLNNNNDMFYDSNNFFVALDGKNGQKSQLYKNFGGGRFENVTAKSQLLSTSFTLAAAAIDYNNDGYDDIYLANDFGADELFINQGDGTFKDMASMYQVNDRGNGMNISFIDVNEDGFWESFVTVIDMYTKNLTFRFPQSSEKFVFDDNILKSSTYLSGNKLFLNSGKFPSLAAEHDYIEPAVYGWCWGAQFFDYENDGDQDLYITNGYAEYSIAGNQANNFLLSDGRYLYRYDSDSPATFKQNSRGVVALDLTNTGIKDLLITNLFSSLTILKNNASQNNSWIKVKLRGIKSNRFGVGAKVTVFTANKKQFSQYVSIGSQYLTQDDTTLTFGLGLNATVTKIRVIWPGKKEQIIKGPFTINQLIEIKENV